MRSEKIDGRQLYAALIDRRTYVAGEVQDLLDRLFDGQAEALIEVLQRPGA